MGLFDRRPRAATAPQPQLPRYGVLLVDDEILNLTSLAGLLEDDYHVQVASSANDALQMLADPALVANVHVIISDQRMPGMTGVELLARSRALKPDAKRLLLTGYTDIDAIIGAINEAAIYKYLRKPLDGQELRLTLARACEAWQLEQDNAGLLAELQQAFARLQLLDADKTAFLRYLAHEMNTPLNWLTAAQVIDRRELGEEAQEMLGFVDQGQERLRGLLTAVLRYFQAAGLELPLHAQKLDLALLLSRQVTALQERFGELVMIRLDQPATLTLESDPELIEEILGHLLENAATHALRVEGRRPQVNVQLRLRDRNVEITISNSGEGPAADVLAALFRPFSFSGAAHGAEGYGLSLATARALAVALGGDLQASTTAGNDGVSLLVQLPVSLPARRPGPAAE